ncbi:hypothetical protein OG21DRAFT_1525063 [Imleria badia]|nr:hypothetical protein OG21DRAFT_1525063 [Imleria badia]
MASSGQKPSRTISMWRPSSSSNRRATGASMAREEPCMEPLPRELPRSFVDNDKLERENVSENTVRTVPRPMDANREISAQPKASEHILEDKEHVKDEMQQTDELSQSFERVHRSSAYHEVASESPICRRHGDDLSPSSPGHKKVKRSDAPKPNTGSSDVESLPQSVEPSKRHEAQSREHESVRGEHQAKLLQRLEEKDYRIRSLQADIIALQRSYEEQSTALAHARHELRSCHSQLDNVQRFISTADTHADQDIIQKVQELNEEVYQVSMMMADYAAEGFVRQNAMARQTKENISVGENVLATIGQVMVNHLAAVVEDEDVALFLQLAFQSYLSHLLCHILSSWTVDPKLNALITGTYQRLQRAEPQAIYGRWRSLTRTHILPTPVSDPKGLVEYSTTELSNIVMAAGLVPPLPGAVSKLSSKFREKMSSIISHAGRFSDMVSGMISADFEVFAIQPGTTFDAESMTDMNDDKMAQRAAGVAQTASVLCVARVGLRKRTGEKIIVLTKAQVVLQSFLY